MDIYGLELHQETEESGIRVTRVPGGWIYTFSTYEERADAWRISSVFVPYDNEFQNKGKQT